MNARSDELIETLEYRATYLSEKARDTPSELLAAAHADNAILMMALAQILRRIG